MVCINGVIHTQTIILILLYLFSTLLLNLNKMLIEVIKSCTLNSVYDIKGGLHITGAILIPLALKGVQYKPIGASALLRRNLLIYGLGGVIVPFVGIKLIDLVVSLFF